MSSIINEQNLEKVKSFRKVLLKVAMWVFVGAIAVGALFILFGGVDDAIILGKIMGTLLIIALLLAVASNNFRRLEDEKKTVQGFALGGLGAGVIAAVIGILACWELIPLYEIATSIRGYTFTNGYTVMGKVLSFFCSIASLGFFGSNILAIKEYDKAGALRPLKIAATIGLCYDIIYSIIIMCLDGQIGESELSDRLAVLAGFAGMVWTLSAIVALIISRSAAKQLKTETMTSEQELLKKVNAQLDELAKAKAENNVKAEENVAPSAALSEEEEMRKEIEKRVRAEMMEKEIREKVEAEMKAKKGE